MKKVLFLIHDLGPGGAEKVLINLVNHMDKTKFDITVHALFDVGVNKQFLEPHIHYNYSFSKVFRGNSQIMKLFTPKQLHNRLIKDHYDIEVAYLEGPCARIISGCKENDTRLISWIHIEQHTAKKASDSFRNVTEANNCYNRFQKIICVSDAVKQDFQSLIPLEKEPEVYYNTNETEKILKLATEDVTECPMPKESIKLIGVGKLLKNKGFDRILSIVNRLKKNDKAIFLYILGEGPERKVLEKYIQENRMEEYVFLLGYQINPYKFVAKADLFVCGSFREGFSTAATEALIVGTPVCTVQVSGMKEMLGENNEYGVVTDNDDEALYQAIKKLIDDRKLLQHYKTQAEKRGKDFSTEETVKAVETMLLNLK